MNTKIKYIAMFFSCITAMNIAIADSGTVQSNEGDVVPVPTVPVFQPQQDQRLAAECTWLPHARIDALQTNMNSDLSILIGGRYYTYSPGNPTALTEAARLMEDLSYRGMKLRLCVYGSAVQSFFWNR